jgi:hypothetical protein
MEIDVNADKTIAAFAAMPADIDAALRAASTQVGIVATSEMKRQIRGGHKLGTPRPFRSPPPTPPMNVTGNLRRAIRPEVRKGFTGYSVIVGSFAVYARRLELGGGNWLSGTKYPFVEPTARIMLQGDRAQNIYTRALRKALKN